MYSSEKLTKDGRSLLIREADGRDAGAVLAYLEAISRESDFLTFGPGEFDLSPEEEAKYLDDTRAKTNCVYLLALCGGEVTGMLSFTAGARPRIQHVGEFGISVRQAHWGRGVASALIDALIEWALAGGIVRKINLRVRTDNERALALYRRKGFVVEGTLTKELFLDGAYYNNHCMGLALPEQGPPDRQMA